MRDGVPSVEAESGVWKGEGGFDDGGGVRKEGFRRDVVVLIMHFGDE